MKQRYWLPDGPIRRVESIPMDCDGMRCKECPLRGDCSFIAVLALEVER